MHNKECICQECITNRNITWVCQHRIPGKMCIECSTKESRTCIHGRHVLSCDTCYNTALTEVQEAEEKEAEKLKPRKTVTRINITDDSALMVDLYTDSRGNLQYWVRTYRPTSDQLSTHCYLDLGDAQAVQVEEKRKLVTIHTCRQHMVVVDWTAT